MSLLCWLAALVTDWPWMALLVLGTITWLSVRTERSEKSEKDIQTDITTRNFSRPPTYSTDGRTSWPEAVPQSAMTMFVNNDTGLVTKPWKWASTQTNALGGSFHALPSVSRPKKANIAKITLENTAGDKTTLAASHQYERKRAEHFAKQAYERMVRIKDDQIARLRKDLLQVANEKGLLLIEAEQHEEEDKGKEMMVYNGIQDLESDIEDLRSRLDSPRNSWQYVPKGSSASNRPSIASSERAFPENVQERLNDVRETVGQTHSLISKQDLELFERKEIEDRLRRTISAFIHAADEENTAENPDFERVDIVANWIRSLPAFDEIIPVCEKSIIYGGTISHPLTDRTPVAAHIQATMLNSKDAREHAKRLADDDERALNPSDTLLSSIGELPPIDNSFDAECPPPDTPLVNLHRPFNHLTQYINCPTSFSRLQFHRWETTHRSQHCRHIVDHGPFVTTLREYAVLKLYQTCPHCGNPNHPAGQECPVWYLLHLENRCEGCYRNFGGVEEDEEAKKKAKEVAEKHYRRDSSDRCRYWDVLELKKGWATWKFDKDEETEEIHTALSVKSEIEPARPKSNLSTVPSPTSPKSTSIKSPALQAIVEEVTDYSD